MPRWLGNRHNWRDSPFSTRVHLANPNDQLLECSHTATCGTFMNVRLAPQKRPSGQRRATNNSATAQPAPSFLCRLLQR